MFSWKTNKAAFPKATLYRVAEVLELVHSDLCGPITPSTGGGNIYIFVLIDDQCRYMWSILLIEEEEEEWLLMLINCKPQSYEEAHELKEWNTACE